MVVGCRWYSENLAVFPSGTQDGGLVLWECMYSISVEFVTPEIISVYVWGVQNQQLYQGDI